VLLAVINVLQFILLFLLQLLLVVVVVVVSSSFWEELITKVQILSILNL